MPQCFKIWECQIEISPQIIPKSVIETVDLLKSYFNRMLAFINFFLDLLLFFGRTCFTLRG